MAKTTPKPPVVSPPPTEAEAASATQPSDGEQPRLVRMVRDPQTFKQCTADVHPDEVENYARGGWMRAEMVSK